MVNNGADPAMRAVYAYGAECTLSTLLILALLMAVGFVLGKPLHMLVYIAAWLPLRMLAGGAHANTHWACTLVSVGLGVAALLAEPWIIKTPAALWAGLAAAGYAVIFFTAPVVHRDHPISKRRYGIMRTAARIYAAAECGLVIALLLLNSGYAAPVFTGFFATAVLAAAGKAAAIRDS